MQQEDGWHRRANARNWGDSPQLRCALEVEHFFDVSHHFRSQGPQLCGAADGDDRVYQVGLRGGGMRALGL